MEKRAGCLAQAKGRPQGTVLVSHQIMTALPPCFKFRYFFPLNLHPNLMLKKHFFILLKHPHNAEFVNLSYL